MGNNNFNLSSLDLGQFGAPGYTLNERLDMSGHSSGAVNPHINADLVNNGNVIRTSYSPMHGFADYRDMTNTPVPGFNGMQNKSY